VIAILALALLVSPALADKPNIENHGTDSRVACDITGIGWTWDGTFTTETCDAAGVPVWAYGTSSDVPATDCDGEPIGMVLGTTLNGPYPNEAGERAILGSFEVTGSSNLLEICHWYDVETSYDGGNVEIYDGAAWTVVSPMGGYPDDLISDSANYYAWCVDMEPGFNGHDPTTFVLDCFDLTNWEGTTVTVAVTFGSDSSVTYPGWYISSVVAGGIITATEPGTWSRVKSLY